MPDATLTSGHNRPAVRFERQLHHSPETVWRALTDPEEVPSWFPGAIITDGWRVGATLTFVNDGHPTFTGEVLELEEPRLLAYTWGDDVLRFELVRRSDGGTSLILTDELDGHTAARNAAGWEVCLGRMFGDSSPDVVWTPRFEHYVTVFEPTLGAQDGPPPGYEVDD